MADTLVTSCPDCNKQATVKAEHVGKKIRCKGCGEVFQIKAEGKKGKEEARPKEKPAAAKSSKPKKEEPKKENGKEKPKPTAPAGDKPPAEGEEDGSNPYGMTTTDMAARCPVCANEMADENAIICLYCGFNTRTRDAVKTKKLLPTTQGEQIMWLMPGFACILAIFVMIGVWALFHFALPYWIYGDQYDVVLALPDVDGSRNKAAGHEKLGNDAFYSYLFHYGIELWLVVAIAFATFYCIMFAIRRLILHPQPPEKLKQK